ncbi:hypothetical protein OIX85_003876 [Vibrio parahaemolyticus]|nr:hypothetical protein [Vibrio parahaemolyticus]
MTAESTKKSLVLSAIDMITPETKKVEKGQESLQAAFDATKKEAAETSKVLSKVNAYESQKAATLKAEAALRKHTKSYEAYKANLEKIKNPSADQINKLADLEYKVSTATLALKTKERALSSTTAAIRKAGFDTDNLAHAQDVLTKKTKDYRLELERQRTALKDVAKAQEERQQKADFISGAVTTAGAGIGAGVLAASMAGISEERSLVRVESTAESKGVQGADQLKDIAREIAASRVGQGVAIQDLHQSMIMAMNSGAKTAEEIEQRVITDLKIYSTVDKERMDFWEVSKQTARMSSLDGASLKETEAFAAALARNYHGTDPEDAFDSYTEVRARTDAAGLDAKDVQAFHLAMLKNNMTGGESSSTLEALAEWVTVGGSNASKDQMQAYATIGLDPTQAAKMAQDDLIGYMDLVYSRIKRLETGDQIAISEQLFGSGFMTILQAMKAGDFRTMQNEVSDSDLLQQDLNARFDKSTATAGAGVDSVMGAMGRVATELFDPLKEPFNSAANVVTDGLNSLADAISRADEKTVQVVAGLAAVAGGTLAVKKVFGLLSAFKSLTTMKAQTVIVNGGLSGTNSDLLDRNKKGKKIGKFDTKTGKKAGLLSRIMGAGESVAGSVAKGGLLKGVGKLAFRALPMVGTAMLAYDAIDSISGLVTGKSIGDHVGSLFASDDSKKPAIEQGVKDSGLSLDKDTLHPDSFQTAYTGGIPSPKEPEREHTTKQTTSEKTLNINVNVSGKVEGLSTEGEQYLVDRITTELTQTTSGMYEREAYG